MTTAVRGELGRPRTVSCSDFNLRLMLESGQVFRWREELSPHSASSGQAPATVPFFTGWIGGSAVRVSQEANQLILKGVSPESARKFFALDLDLPAIARQIDVDPIIHNALGRYPGLRVIRQDPWECAASFMLSAYNNIPRLTAMLDTLASGFGRSLAPARERVRSRSVRAVRRDSWTKYAARTSKLTHSAPGQGLGAYLAAAGPGPAVPLPERGMARPNSFPGPEVLAGVSERALRSCGLGYRAPYLRGMAQMVASGRTDLERLRALEDEELRRALLALPGIGEKVVECVMLFAYGRTSAFPVDVWIGRAMRGWYFRRRKVSDRRIREFARKRFGPYCGWAQQYLYGLARRCPENS